LVRPQAALGAHPRGGGDARRHPLHARAGLLGAMAERGDRVRKLASRDRVDTTCCARAVAARGAQVTVAGESVVLYDAECGFCKWSLDKILAWDRAQKLRPVRIQSEEGERLLAEADPEARLDSWHLVTSDGRLFSAGAAAEPL